MAGLVFLRARFYDPSIGRFLTKDPFPGFPSLPSTLHPYTYAMNNPVNLVDPSGQNPLLILAAASFLAGVGVSTWMQYQANNGWCGFDPLLAFKWGISAAFISTLVALTAIEAAALLGMGLQGFGVLINWLPVFSAGLKFSAAAGAAAVWFMTGKRLLGAINNRFIDLGTDKASGQYRQTESDAAVRLESKIGQQIERYDPQIHQGKIGDWILRHGSTYTSYDAVGPLPHMRYFNLESFTYQIESHLSKQGLDYVVVDLSGLEASQIADVQNYLSTLAHDLLARIILLGP
ncbi:MAG: hypothetical protein IIC79_05385 [Chloroflexi bacterium]|nr:hypothetical protein [Chloroflexota bacterium]